MIVIPAIDIIGGKAVRLYQGDYRKKEMGVDFHFVAHADENETNFQKYFEYGEWLFFYLFQIILPFVFV